MLRSILLYSGVALAVTLAAGCKKEKDNGGNAGRVNLESVLGTYKGSLTTQGKTEDREVELRKANAVERGLGADYTIDNVPALVQSNGDGKVVFTFKGVLAKGEATVEGTTLTYTMTFGQNEDKREFKGTKK